MHSSGSDDSPTVAAVPDSQQNSMAVQQHGQQGDSVTGHGQVDHASQQAPSPMNGHGGHGNLIGIQLFPGQVAHAPEHIPEHQPRAHYGATVFDDHHPQDEGQIVQIPVAPPPQSAPLATQHPQVVHQVVEPVNVNVVGGPKQPLACLSTKWNSVQTTITAACFSTWSAGPAHAKDVTGKDGDHCATETSTGTSADNSADNNSCTSTTIARGKSSTTTAGGKRCSSYAQACTSPHSYESWNQRP